MIILCLIGIYLLIGMVVALAPLFDSGTALAYRDMLLRKEPDLEDRPILTKLYMFAGASMWIPAWPLLFMEDEEDL